MAWKRLLAVVLGVVPPYSVLVALQLRAGAQLTLRSFVLYLGVIAPLAIVVALLLLRFVCGESPRELNLKPGKASSDLLAVLVLALVILAANLVSTFLLSQLLPESPTNTSVRSLFAKLAGSPGLLALFAGPLLFLGAASEEVIRAFLLGRLWKVWPSTAGKIVVILVSACLFGVIHLYQGPVRAGWTAVFGLVMAFYYLRFGRVVPMVLAHYLTNALQLVAFSAAAR